MGPFFLGGERIQRGRGVGGFLRSVAKLFKPLGSLAAKAAKSSTGKQIANAVKSQAIDSSLNVVKDLASGKGVKESLKDEFKNVKQNAKRKILAFGDDYLKEKKSKRVKKIPSSSKNQNRTKLKRKRDIFD